jgi:hypothetical protein
MTAHPLVTQLRFARSELARCLEGINADDAVKRMLPMNCISWIVGHLANQEQAYWILIAQDKIVVAGLNDLVGFGKPASTPPLVDMLDAWKIVTIAADTYLNTLTTEKMQEHLLWKGQPRPESIGTMLLRNTYHYWFHIGEAHAIRQMLGHPNLPQFVGDMSSALYRAE